MMEIVPVLAVLTMFGVIPVSIMWGIFKIVQSVQRRRIAEAYARQGMLAPTEEESKPKKMGDAVLVRALALVGVALGLGLGCIWENDILTVALIIGLGGLGMLAAWLIIRTKESKQQE